MKKYLKQHFIVVITLFAAVISTAVLNFISEVTIIENLIIALLILLITTFVFDFNKMLDKILLKEELLEKKLGPESVSDFDSVDKCASEISHKISTGKHTIDFVSLDAKIRTPKESKRKVMAKLLEKFVTSEKIKLRYISTVNSENYRTILNFIILSKGEQKNSFYAICDCELPFASFYIIDKKYLVIRTPYNSSVEKHYCIINDKSICSLFSSWFEMIWQTSQVIEKKDQLQTIFKNEKFTTLNTKELDELLNKAVDFFE